MVDHNFLKDLAIVLLMAGIVTVIFNRFRQPVVLGYIIAGIIIGPHTPPFPLISNTDSIATLAELGVIFLMFSLGLEFNLKKLTQVGFAAFIAATLEIVAMCSAGYILGRVFGWSKMDSLFLGGILAISSTTIIIKAFKELKKTREKFAEIVFGILVVEDLLGILILALLSTFATSGTIDFETLLSTSGQLLVFLIVVFIVGLLLVPRVLEYVGRFKNSEMLLVTTLGICFGVSLLASYFEYSVALGAFLIGAIVSESKEAIRVEGLTHSLRDLFGSVFFVAVGLMLDPRVIVENFGAIIAVTVVVIVGKVLSCAFGTLAAGNDLKTSLSSGLSLAQIGEFSFIIASLGATKGVTSGFLYPVAVTVSVLTTFTTPYLIRSASGLTTQVEARLPSRVLTMLQEYTRGFEQARKKRLHFLSDDYIRGGLIQLAVNLSLIAAVFLGARVLIRADFAWLKELPLWERWDKTIVWLGAMLLTLPLQVMSLRKINRMAASVGEKVAQSASFPDWRGFSTTVSVVVSIAGTLSFLGVIFLLSSTFFPPAGAFLVFGAAIFLLGFYLRNHYISIYRRARGAIEETLAQQPESDEEPKSVFEALPAEARLEPFVLEAAPHITGKLILETELRKRTGASIVCIERDGTALVNPLPTEVLAEGDRIYLFGRPEQLDEAKKYLVGIEV